jgi:hypothetical protein
MADFIMVLPERRGVDRGSSFQRKEYCPNPNGIWAINYFSV